MRSFPLTGPTSNPANLPPGGCTELTGRARGWREQSPCTPAAPGSLQQGGSPAAPALPIPARAPAHLQLLLVEVPQPLERHHLVEAVQEGLGLLLHAPREAPVRQQPGEAGGGQPVAPGPLPSLPTSREAAGLGGPRELQGCVAGTPSSPPSAPTPSSSPEHRAAAIGERGVQTTSPGCSLLPAGQRQPQPALGERPWDRESSLTLSPLSSFLKVLAAAQQQAARPQRSSVTAPAHTCHRPRSQGKQPRPKPHVPTPEPP